MLEASQKTVNNKLTIYLNVVTSTPWLASYMKFNTLDLHMKPYDNSYDTKIPYNLLINNINI